MRSDIQIQQFQSEIWKVISRFAKEYELSNAAAVGAIMEVQMQILNPDKTEEEEE